MLLGKKLYSDIDMNLSDHPVTGDVSRKTDHMAVTQALKNLVLMNHYEKPFHPEIGTGIRQLLFEMIDVNTTASLREEIKNTINNFEPRVILQQLDVIPDYENNGYTINIKYSVINIPQPVSIQFLLERLR
jgi:phage baseplate assembly protein W